MTTYRQHELVLISENFDWFAVSLIVTIKFNLIVTGDHPQNDFHKF